MLASHAPERCDVCYLVQEEARLAYVGMTRAKDCLYLSWPEERLVTFSSDPAAK